MDHHGHHPKPSTGNGKEPMGSSMAQTGHDKHSGHHVADFLKRFWLCSLVSIPIVALSPMIQQLIGFQLSFVGDRYLLAALSTFIFMYGGYPFLKGLYDEVKDNAIGMMTLIGVAITVESVRD